MKYFTFQSLRRRDLWAGRPACRVAGHSGPACPLTRRGGLCLGVKRRRLAGRRVRVRAVVGANAPRRAGAGVFVWVFGCVFGWAFGRAGVVAAGLAALLTLAPLPARATDDFAPPTQEQVPRPAVQDQTARPAPQRDRPATQEPTVRSAENPTSPPEAETPTSEPDAPSATGFFRPGQVSGGVYFYRRDRRRYDRDLGRYQPNLNHASAQASLEYQSGFWGDVIGVDFGMFGAHDLFNKGAVDHEMGFVPWGDPWHPDWSKRSTDDGVSVYKAALKLKAGPVWARAGYFQPSGPGVLGVNWSFLPGTYRGVNAGMELDRLSVAVAWADEYKSPWFVNMNRFMKNDGETRVPWLWSSGVRYAFANGLTLELAYGESRGHLKNGNIKSSYAMPLGKGTLNVGYHLYLMDDSDDSGSGLNDNFDGLASLHYLFGRYDLAPWTLRLESTWARAPMSGPYSQGNFVYRLADRNGSAAGAYSVWWDARSDWNADNEKAFYAAVERKLDDLLPLPGVYVGAGAALGIDGRGWDSAEHLKEWAFTFDLGYIKPDGPLQGSFVKLHYTEYRNGTSKPSWTTYKNAFQSEHDLKILVGFLF